MASSLFGQTPRQQPTNSMQLMSQFQKFMHSGITPEKAQNILQEKLKSGELSEERFKNLQNQARQFSQMLQVFK